MPTIVAIGSSHVLDGFALAGVTVRHTDSDTAVVVAWNALEPDVGLLILSPDAATVLDGHLDERPDVLTAVSPR